MKAVKTIFLVLMLPLASIAQVPGVAQHVASSNGAMSTGCCSSYIYQLPDGTRAGNAIVAVVSYSDNPATTVSVTDDQNQTYVTGPTAHDSVNGRIMALFYKLNTVANARTITISFSSPVMEVQPRASELYNIDTTAAPDGSSGIAGTDGSTTVTAGNITPSTSGDLMYQCASRTENPAAASFVQGSQANITWQFLDADLLDGMACQWGVYSSTSLINPTLTMSPGSAYVSVAIALKAAAAGSAPVGMHIARILHENIPQAISGTSPQILQTPCSGNLPVIKFSSGGGLLITSITDSNNNTWFQMGTDSTNGSGPAAETTQTFVSYGAVCAAKLVLTINVTGGGGQAADGTLFFYDIDGASAKQRARRIKATGSQSNGGNLTSQIFDTPGNDRGLVLTSISVDLNTVTGLTGGGLVDTNRCGGCSVDGPISVDENDGWGHYWITSNNLLPITWTFLAGDEGIGGWAADAVAFNALHAHIYPNYEQSVACKATTTDNTVTCDYTPLQPNNSTLAIMAGTTATNGGISLSDTAGNTIEMTNPATGWSEGELATFYVPQAISQTPTTFTVTYGTSSTFRDIIIDDFSGLSLVDSHSIATPLSGPGGNFNTGPWTTRETDEVIWGGALCHSTCDLSIAPGFTLGGSDGNGDVTVWAIGNQTIMPRIAFADATANFIDSAGSGYPEGAGGASFYLVQPTTILPKSAAGSLEATRETTSKTNLPPSANH
jgi:hypothetical protein